MKRIFNEKQVNVSAFLAGPIPPGFLIYRNYKALGKEKEANIALASTLIFTVVFFYIIFQIPQAIVDKIPDVAFTSLYGIGVFLFFRNYLAEDVNEALQAGAEKASNWTVAGFTVLGLILNLAIIFGLASSQPFYEGEVVKVNGNELYYDQSVPREDIDKLINNLKNDFFSDDYGNIARIQLNNKDYLITIVVDEMLWSDLELINYFTRLKWIMEMEYDKTTHIKFESINYKGDPIYKEL